MKEIYFKVDDDRAVKDSFKVIEKKYIRKRNDEEKASGNIDGRGGGNRDRERDSRRNPAL